MKTEVLACTEISRTGVISTGDITVQSYFEEFKPLNIYDWEMQRCVAHCLVVNCKMFKINQVI